MRILKESVNNNNWDNFVLDVTSNDILSISIGKFGFVSFVGNMKVKTSSNFLVEVYVTTSNRYPKVVIDKSSLTNLSSHEQGYDKIWEILIKDGTLIKIMM